MRVVAWHNRHPLARRINATQVHSIGEVLLPFAGSMATPASGVAARGLPAVDDLLDPPQSAALFDTDTAKHPNTNTDTNTDANTATETNAEPVASWPAAAAADQPDTGASPFTLAEADLAAQAAEAARTTQAEPGPQDLALQVDLSLTLDPPPEEHPVAHTAPGPDPGTRSAAATAPAQVRSSPFAAALAARSAGLSAGRPPVPVSRLQRLLARLPGRPSALPRLQAVFSRDFIWPLSPRQVAHWARRHGQLQPVAPADWPRRVVETDSALLAAARQKGLGQSVALHVLTAAVGVGDRRLRLLMAADGRLIGPRAYSPPRLAAAGTLLALTLLVAGWAGLPPRAADAASVLAAADAATATAAATPAASASASASASATPAPPASASATAQAMLAASAAGPAPALAAAPATSLAAAEPVHALGPGGPHNPAAALAPASPQPPQAAAATPADLAAVATATAAAAAPSASTDATPVGSSAALKRIRPALSEQDKQAARDQTAALRSGQPAAAAPAARMAPTSPKLAIAPSPPAAATLVYALVTQPNPLRESANIGLAVMRRTSGRLTPPVPEHTELMQDQGRWRAAWWPFVNLADAERARVLLASKGIKVEVVEF